VLPVAVQIDYPWVSLGKTLVETILGRIPRMKTTTVQKIIRPYRAHIPMSPSVGVNDTISRAIQIMLGFGLNHMAVVRNHRPIGMVCLQEALQTLGIPSMNDPHEFEKRTDL
jgi:CBS domain